MSDTPRTNEALTQVLDRDGRLEDDNAPFVLVRLAKTLERELNATKAVRCDWKEDDEGNWDTSCKQCMCFDYAPPAVQGYKFCHHCRATINFIEYQIEEESL
jgi:hypothetical protein